MGKGSAIGACLLVATVAGDLRAEPPAHEAGANVQAPREPSRGLAVLAPHAMVDAAWPLAQQLYARPTLRPSGLDEARARVLAGEDPPADAPQALRDLAETREAIHGDDAPSRQLLTSMANQLHVRGLVVVRAPEGVAPSSVAPTARVFLADASAFDAASYAPERPADSATHLAWTWTGTVGSLERAYGAAPTTAAPKAATSPTPEAPKKASGHPFYTSPWFWGVIAGSAAAGLGIFLATRDGSSDTIHLQMQVPR